MPRSCHRRFPKRVSPVTPRHGAPLTSLSTASTLHAQTPASPPTSPPAVPTWAQPGSATHTQVAPPTDFHRPATTFNTPIGIFYGQSDVGSAVIPGSASYDAATKQYTIHSAGYNVWYTRDEFHYLWKKMSGDVSIAAASVNFPRTERDMETAKQSSSYVRASMTIRRKRSSRLHGAGMIQLAQRAETNIRVKDMEYRIGGRGLPGGASPDSLVSTPPAQRIGIEKHGDEIALFVSLEGEPMHQYRPPIKLHFDGPSYVGIGFCSHLPDKI